MKELVQQVTKKFIFDIKCVGCKSWKKIAAYTEKTLCKSFKYSSGTITRITWSKPESNLAIFGPFLDLQEFFQNRELTVETLDLDFCDQLNEFFHTKKKNLKKTNSQNLF